MQALFSRRALLASAVPRRLLAAGAASLTMAIPAATPVCQSPWPIGSALRQAGCSRGRAGPHREDPENQRRGSRPVAWTSPATKARPRKHAGYSRRPCISRC